MEDSRLQKACRKFAEDSLRILASTADTQLPMREALAVIINEDRTGFRTSNQQVPDLYLYLFRNYDKIASSTAFKAFVNYMSKIEKLKKLYTDYEIERSLPTRFLVKLLRDNEEIVWKLNEAKFKKIYENFESYLFSETVPYKSFVVLPQLEIETEEIVLKDELKIKKLSDKEFEKLVEVSTLGMPHLEFLSPEKVVLERVFGVRKKPTVVMNSPTTEQNGVTRNLFLNVITTLRLFKKGKVGFDTIYGENLSDWEGGGFRGGSSPAFPETRGGRLKLEKSEEVDFVKFWKFFNNIKLETLDKNLRIAVSRFNSAFERRDAEDKLIDYVIALTALFSKKDEAGLGRYRLSMRVALFLAKKPEERKKVRKEILEIYDVRSAIVHGNDIKKFRNFKDLKTLVDRTEDYLRRSIKDLLQLNLKIGGRSKIIDKIENSLFSAPIDY